MKEEENAETVKEQWGELANYTGKQGWQARVHERKDEREGSERENGGFKMTVIR